MDTNSDAQSDEEIEYEEIEEEIEVEEEVEVEEEEEVEVEEEEEVEVEEEEEEEDDDHDDDKDIGEELTPINQINDKNDPSHVIELDRYEEHFKPGSATPEKSVVNLPGDTSVVEGNVGNCRISRSSETRQNEESQIDGRVTLIDQDDGASLCDKWGRNGENTSLFVGEVNAATSHIDASSKNANDDPCYEKGSYQIVEGNVGNCRISQSSETRQNEESQIHGRVTLRDHDDGASLCDKWRRNGENTNLSVGEVNAATSHVDASSKNANDDPCFEKGTYQIVGEDSKGEASRVRPRSSSPESEFNDGSKRLAVICDFFAKGWCIKGNSCRFLHIKDQVAMTGQCKEGIGDTVEKKSELAVEEAASASQHMPHCGESPREKSETQELPLLKGDFLLPSSQDFGQEFNLEGNRGYSLSMSKSSYIHGVSSNSYARLSENCGSTRNTSHMTSLDEVTCKRSQFLANGYNLPVSISSLHRSPLAFSYPSWNTDSHSNQKVIDSNQEYHTSKSASIQRSSSPFSGFESGSLSETNASGDKQCSARSKTKMSYNWEPSVPFRPSFLLTQSLLSSGSLYDPIRDSIEQTSLVAGLPKISNPGKETSALRKHMQASADPFPPGTLGTECSSNKYAVADKDFRGIFSANNLTGKDLSTAEEKETIGAEWQNRKALLKEEKFLNSDHVRGVMEADRNSIDCDSKLDSGGRHRPESQEEWARQINEADADLKVEESRTLKNFHASLVEVVKELLKPSWHEGLLSKDAHKKIVKKAVEKVLITLQPHQIPTTSELIKQYLSSSHKKLAKLVEGYVDKYSKS